MADQKMMSIQVPTRLLGTALMVCRVEADFIISVLNNALPAGMYPFKTGREEASVVNGVGCIPVNGGLAYRGYGWFWQTTYQDIRRALQQAVHDPEVKAIVLDVCSPGGEVAGVFDLVDEIYAARSKKHIVAVANEDAFSAAYAIASAAHKVYLPRTGRLGSIGVIAIHYEQSKAEAMAGVKYTSIYAGARKNDFSMHAPLSKEAHRIAQASVERVYELFLQAVARNRMTTAENIRNQQAAIFAGVDAVKAGLADEVKTFEQVLEEVSSTKKPFYVAGKGAQAARSSLAPAARRDLSGGLGAIRNALASAILSPGSKKSAEAMLLKLGFAPLGQPGSCGAVADAKKAAAKAETEKAIAIMQKSILACAPELAGELIQKGVAEEAAGTRLLEYKHNHDLSAGLSNLINGLGVSGSDYLLADAKRRAAAAQPKAVNEA